MNGTDRNWRLLQEIKNLTARQALYILLIVLSLTLPGMTYIFIYHNDYIMNPDLIRLIVSSVIFSVPFLACSFIIAAVSYKEFVLRFVKSNYKGLTSMSKDKRRETINEKSYHYFGVYTPFFAIVFFYAVLFIYRVIHPLDNFWSVTFVGAGGGFAFALLTLSLYQKKVPKKYHTETEKIIRESDIGFLVL